MTAIKWIYRILVAGGFILVLDHRLVVIGVTALLCGLCVGAYYVVNADKYQFRHKGNI